MKPGLWQIIFNISCNLLVPGGCGSLHQDKSDSISQAVRDWKVDLLLLSLPVIVQQGKASESQQTEKYIKNEIFLVQSNADASLVCQVDSSISPPGLNQLTILFSWPLYLVFRIQVSILLVVGPEDGDVDWSQQFISNYGANEQNICHKYSLPSRGWFLMHSKWLLPRWGVFLDAAFPFYVFFLIRQI